MSLVFSTASGYEAEDGIRADKVTGVQACAPPTVSIAVTDDDTGSDTGSLDITVHNVAPSVALSGALNVDEGSTHTDRKSAAEGKSVDLGGRRIPKKKNSS